MTARTDWSRSRPGLDDGRPLRGFLSADRLVQGRRITAPAPAADRSPGTGGLEVWLTGTGSPNVLPGRSGPSTLLLAGSDLILVDCGNGSAYQVAQLGLSPHTISYVFITHHHVDHNADLPFLLMSGWISHRRDYVPPRIVGPPGTLKFVNRLLALHEYDIRARLDHHYSPERLTPEVVEIADGTIVGGDGWRITAFRVDHYPVCEAYGYRIDTDQVSMGISGDTRPCENLVHYLGGVDVLIHECIYPGYGYPEYHTLSTEVGTVATHAGAARLVLTHLLPGDLPDEQWLEHIRRDYAGPASVGYDLMKVL